MFAMGLFFSGTSPIQAVFTCVYFTTYYWVEKYNLAFVYNKEYDGVGTMYKPVIPMMVIILYLFEFMLIGYFSLRNKEYFLGGLIFIIVQTVIFFLLNTYAKKKRRQDKLEIALLEQGVDPLA